MLSEVSGSLIVRDKNLLMVFDDEKQTWHVPAGQRLNGELSAEAAERITTEMTGCDSEVVRYKGGLKTSFNTSGKEMKFQPYIVDVSGEPEEGEWVPINDLESKKLAEPLTQIREKLANKL